MTLLLSVLLPCHWGRWDYQPLSDQPASSGGRILWPTNRHTDIFENTSISAFLHLDLSLNGCNNSHVTNYVHIENELCSVASCEWTSKGALEVQCLFRVTEHGPWKWGHCFAPCSAACLQRSWEPLIRSTSHCPPFGSSAIHLLSVKSDGCFSNFPSFFFLVRRCCYSVTSQPNDNKSDTVAAIAQSFLFWEEYSEKSKELSCLSKYIVLKSELIF